jgi:hypothetical protein
MIRHVFCLTASLTFLAACPLAANAIGRGGAGMRAGHASMGGMRNSFHASSFGRSSFGHSTGMMNHAHSQSGSNFHHSMGSSSSGKNHSISAPHHTPSHDLHKDPGHHTMKTGEHHSHPEHAPHHEHDRRRDHDHDRHHHHHHHFPHHPDWCHHHCTPWELDRLRCGLDVSITACSNVFVQESLVALSAGDVLTAPQVQTVVQYIDAPACELAEDARAAIAQLLQPYLEESEDF